MSPDLELLHAFGNEDVYADKLAGRAELVARLAMGLIGYGSGRTELARQRSLQAEAEAMNAAFEHMQAMKLQQAESGARHTRPPIVIPAPVPGMRRWDGDAVPIGYDEGMVRMASVAYDVGANMAKEALSIEPLVNTAKSIFGKVGPALSQGVGKVVGATAQGPKMPTLAAASQKITGGLQAAPKPPPALGQAAPALAGGAAMTAGGLALGGLAVKGAVGGLKKGLDVMSREAGPQQYGTQQYGGTVLPYGINEYGQPDTRTRFM